MTYSASHSFTLTPLAHLERYDVGLHEIFALLVFLDDWKREPEKENEKEKEKQEEKKGKKARRVTE